LLVVVAGCAESPQERRWDIYELARDPTPANVARIRAMLDDPDRDIRATALNKLVGLGVEDAEPIALSGLDDEDGFVRSIAAKRIGDLGNLEHTDRLIAVVSHDPDPRARETAVVSLEGFGSDAAIEGLILGLDDPMSRVRLAAVNAVRRLAPEKAKATLARLVLEDSSWEIRVQAAGALGRTGDSGMVPVLEAAEKDESELVRSAAARALTQLER
jgi:HEAT repeat protein